VLFVADTVGNRIAAVVGLTGEQFTYDTHVAPAELFGLTGSPDGHRLLFVNDSVNNVELAH
jgi:hypothetical protein